MLIINYVYNLQDLDTIKQCYSSDCWYYFPIYKKGVNIPRSSILIANFILLLSYDFTGFWPFT